MYEHTLRIMYSQLAEQITVLLDEKLVEVVDVVNSEPKHVCNMMEYLSNQYQEYYNIH